MIRLLASLAMITGLTGNPSSPADTLLIPEFELDTLVFSFRKPGIEMSPLPGVGTTIPVSILKKLPSVMGTADPLRFASFLPSVQTGNELDSGLHIQGCENAHNYIAMAEAPIYGAGHMLGFASVFNSSHFTEMNYGTAAPWLNRLGGVLDMQLPSLHVYEPQLEASAGLFMSQATLRLPAGRSSFFLSARHSYFNLLYSNWLKFNDAPFHYDFGDYNATWLWTPGDDDTITFNAYYGKDDADYGSEAWQIDAFVRWMNGVASLDWLHRSGEWSLKQTLYGSFYLLQDDIRMDVTQESAPSHIQTYGYKARLGNGKWDFLAETAAHFTQPLQPVDVEIMRQRGWETSVQAGYTLRPGKWLLSASVRGTWYLSPERQSFWTADPKAEISYASSSVGTFGLRAGTAHQYLFQTGPTNMGFPCEYWLLAGDISAPQSSRYGILSWSSASLLNGWSISLEGYFRDLSNQVEFEGSLLDYTSPAFDLESHLIKGRGVNYGVNVTVQKTEGHFTGWLSYAYGQALRHSDYPGYPEWYHSQHERLHEANLVALYDFGKWDVGATVVAASGLPFTDAEAFYIVGSKVLTVFGEHNAARLKPYIRADLSANIYFRKTEKLRHGMNISLYNATGHKNEISRMLRTDNEGKYFYGSVRFVMKVLPSVGYFIRF